jgi:uncharacterized MAPEG superfamily protein
MKAKNIVIAQILLLVGVVVAGLILKSDLNEGPRQIHRIAASLAGLATVVSTGLLLRADSTVRVRLIAFSAAVATFLAGWAGKSLKGADNYDLVFNSMRAFGVIALVVSVVLLRSLTDTTQPASKPSPKK